jgi:hypothetical protein
VGLPTSAGMNTNIQVSNPGKGFSITNSIQSSIFGDRVVFGLYHYDRQTNEIESILDGKLDEFISGSSRFFAEIVGAVNAGEAKETKHE